MRKIVRSLFVGPTGIRSFWGMLLYFVFVILIAAVFLVAIQGRRVHIGGAEPFGLMKSEFPAFAAVLCATWIMAKLEGRTLTQFGFPTLRSFSRNFWLGATWGLLLEGTSLLGLARFHIFSFGPIELPTVRALVIGSAWLVGASGIAFFEESFFRGYPLFTMSRGMRFWPATILVAALFAAAHLHNIGQTGVGAFGIFVATIFLCLTVRRTGNLWFAIGLHSFLDWSEIFLFGVPQGQPTSGILRHSEMHGPIWLTGTDGNEGSIVFIVLVLISMIVFDRLYPKSRYPAVDSV